MIRQTSEPAQPVQDIQTIKMRDHAWAVWLIILFGGGALILLMAFSITEGATKTPLSTVWDVLLHFNRQDTHYLIIVDLHLPRVLTNALIGAAFAVAEAAMQGAARNPMADSGLIGLSADAGFILSLYFAFFPGLSYLRLVLFSFTGTTLGAGLVNGIASLRCGGASPMHLVPAGATAGAFLSALSQGVALYFSVAQSIMPWTIGGVAGFTWPQIRIMTPWIAGTLLGIIVLSRSVSIISLGEDVTRSLGLNTLLVRALYTAVVLMLADASVAVVSSVDFVGLVVSHVVRSLVGRDCRRIIPVSAVLGGLLMVLADLGTRMPSPPFETPTGAVTALIGVLFFLCLARRERRALQ